MARAVQRLLVAAVVVGLSQGPALVDAHGSLIQPRPRNTYFFNDPTARVYDTNAGNGLGPQPFRPVGQPGEPCPLPARCNGAEPCRGSSTGALY